MNSINYIEIMNEYCLEKNIDGPDYKVVSRDGINTNTVFTVALYFQGETFTASATSVRSAEQQCACQAVDVFDIMSYLKMNTTCVKYKIIEVENVLNDVWHHKTDTIFIILKQMRNREQSFKKLQLKVENMQDLLH